MTQIKNTEEVISTLVKLADMLDQEGKDELAEEVDGTLKSFADESSLLGKLPERKTATMSKDEFVQKFGQENFNKLADVSCDTVEIEMFDGDFLVKLITTPTIWGGKYENYFSKASSIKSLAARPRAPLKSLKDVDKKNLITFLYNANKNVESSIKGIEELFRRMKYFGVEGIINETRLDKILNVLKSVQPEINNSVNKFYEFSNGRKPGKDGIQKLFNNDGQVASAEDDFFADKKTEEDAKEIEKPIEPEESVTNEHCEQCADDCSGVCDCHDSVSGEELEDFWK